MLWRSRCTFLIMYVIVHLYIFISPNKLHICSFLKTVWNFMIINWHSIHFNICTGHMNLHKLQYILTAHTQLRIFLYISTTFTLCSEFHMLTSVSNKTHIFINAVNIYSAAGISEIQFFAHQSTSKRSNNLNSQRMPMVVKTGPLVTK